MDQDSEGSRLAQRKGRVNQAEYLSEFMHLWTPRNSEGSFAAIMSREGSDKS